MKYAKKIDLKLDVQIRSLLHHPVLSTHGFGVGEYKGGRLVRRYIPKKYSETFKQSLPAEIQKNFLGLNLTEIRLLAPHVHLEDKCVINFYQETNGEVTNFWEGELERDDDWVLDNGAGFLNVNPKKLMIAEMFVAQPGDCWLLNTLQPHSVSMLNDDRPGMLIYEPKDTTPRLLIQGYFDAPFEEVAAHF
jgi:hypothetical protein